MSFIPSQIAGEIAVSRAEDLRRSADRARLIRRVEASHPGADSGVRPFAALMSSVRGPIATRAASRHPSATAAECR